MGIEVKIQGSVSELGYQVLRYARHDDIRGVVIVTTKSVHLALPAEIEDKPVRVLHLLGSAF